MPTITAQTLNLKLQYDSRSGEFTLATFEPTGAPGDLTPGMRLGTAPSITWYFDTAGATAQVSLVEVNGGKFLVEPSLASDVTIAVLEIANCFAVTSTTGVSARCDFVVTYGACSSGSKMVLLPTPKGGKPKDGGDDGDGKPGKPPPRQDDGEIILLK